jgi:hypothetical protein
MRLRVLTAAVVAAWSKTAAATTAAVLPGVVEQPATASVSRSTSATTSCTDPEWFGPDLTISGSPSVTFKSSSGGCFPGTLSLQASLDQSHWKTLTSRHETATDDEAVSHPCLSGTWWYQGQYATDDGTFKGTSPQAQFTGAGGVCLP